MIRKIIETIKHGEGLKIEFKESKNRLNKDVYETVCAFLNRSGGELFLGVKDDGEIVGVDEGSISQIRKDFVTSMNNGNKISPTYYLSIEEIKIQDKTILYIFVPESSQVHRCNGRVFDRNDDGDLNITDHTNQVAALYERKQRTYSENRVYPYLTINDLRKDIIARVRKLAINQRLNHPWENLSDIELLKSAGLYIKDYQKGEEGFTLASVLLLGKDEVIQSVIPYHRTDAILRKENIDRYDDREDIRTNLIESYDRLMAFVAKHLPDKFYLEADQRISIRDHIFREVVSNILIHRDYGNPYPAKLVIGNNEIYTENSNKPHGHGLIDPNNFSPYPKNPVIARFFKEIGWVDELGSGVRKIHKYSRFYFGFDAKIIEEDIFRIILQTSTSKFGNKGERYDERIMSGYERIMSDFNKNEKEIIIFLMENDKITNKLAVEVTKLSPSHVRRIFKSLQEKGLIVARDRGRNRYYTLKPIEEN
ncbi:winged helix-turn-helix transcriptional regulator [Alkaliphilus pronyensis]|uniref:Winged helix-turn-helix transcriptional regulator n=1 Tax=Alkaliphilus pronyensis TaxID=1482732 RepID=A0A6I0EZG9_9FIRM|nr:RNA-binding domain-containing protein [Alkaliphilus pronyensis]KAB3535368.1 winged helix-turn-helix transcriptional regulator [Alkaliphilus pronyensis]